MTKENEKLLHKDHVFQTKDFENFLDVYKVYRQRLYKRDREGLDGTEAEGLTDKWNKVHEDKVVIFYDQVKDDEDNEHWFEFEFTFNNGKLDKKKLLSVKVETTAKERADINEMWDIEQEIFNEYRENNFPYKLYTWLEKRLQKMTNWARRRAGILPPGPVPISLPWWRKIGHAYFCSEPFPPRAASRSGTRPMYSRVSILASKPAGSKVNSPG